MSSTELAEGLEIFEPKPGLKFGVGTLKAMLPDVETILFFAMVYDLDARQVGALLHKLLRTDLTSALFVEGGQHSNDLQDYMLDTFGDEEWYAQGVADGEITHQPDVPKGEILPEVWKSLEVTVASSIKEVAGKLEGVVARLPGKEGSMVFRSMMTMNAKRPTLGNYRAGVQHARQQDNLLILDASGSMNEDTVRRIVDDVVALSYSANAHMAVVSNTVTFWSPGSYGVDDVLAACEYLGTHYEELAPLFDRDWGTVITVADYDSSYDAKRVLADCVGRIDQVIDVSLVNRPTFLAECVGQLAADVKPALIGSSSYVLT